MDEQVHEGLVDHAMIDKSFRALVDALDHPDTGDAALLLCALADRLRSHIAREELDIVKFADVDQEEAKSLLHDHASFRTTLVALEAQSKAGNLSPREVHDLKLRFSLHEAREETGLYRWVKAI